MTTAVLRPISSTPYSGTLTGAATNHAALSDNSDASYLGPTGLAGPNTDLGMGSLTLPALAVTKAVVGLVRVSSALGASFYLYDYTIGARLVEVSGVTTLGTATGSAVAVNWSQAQINALVANASGSGGSGMTARIYEVYYNLTYVTAAVTTISYPTGSPTLTTTSSITATWTSVVDADADGASRDRYRVKVFTAAQYGAGGFDPETSTAFYDSGVVVSTAQAQVITGLPNSTTFRVYVKVGDSVNGVQHFGAWQGGAGSQFSTSFTTADILSVVGTADNANARISVVVTRVTAGSPPTWETIEVQRSDDGGTTWVNVRGANGVAVSGATWSGYEYEAPPAVSVLFRARATYHISGAAVTGPWQTSAGVTWTTTVAWLKDPFTPSLNRTVKIRQWPDPEHGIAQGVFYPLGSETPTVVSDVRQAGAGQYVFQTATAAEAVAMKALLYRPFLLLQQPATWDNKPNQYLALSGWSENHLIQKIRTYRRWTVKVIEIDQPAT